MAEIHPKILWPERRERLRLLLDVANQMDVFLASVLPISELPQDFSSNLLAFNELRPKFVKVVLGINILWSEELFNHFLSLRVDFLRRYIF